MRESQSLNPILFWFFLTLLVTSISFGQKTVPNPSRDFSREIYGKEDTDFIRQHQSKGIETPSKKVRFIYLVPQDRPIRDDYKAAIADAALHLQDWYQKELGNDYAYRLNDPIVEVHQTPHTADWYANYPFVPNPVFPDYRYWVNATGDGFAATGGSFDDPYNRWIFFLDAQIGCVQPAGGTHGVALLHLGDLRGLTGQSYISPCNPNDPPDTSSKYRYVGGVGHEMGHSFNLPHPPGCGTDPYETSALMCGGYGLYPNTYFLSADKTFLLNDPEVSQFFSPTDLREPRIVDFDKDRKTDFSVWRPSNTTWYTIPSSGSSPTSTVWGLATDKVAPGDFDGDTKTDIAVWRPSNGTWYIIQSSDGTYRQEQWGASGDHSVAGDYDGDRRADLAIWRPATATWWIKRSATNIPLVFAFGAATDLPVPADYNGDKRTDIAVFRPSLNNWYVYQPYLSYYYSPAPGGISYTTTNFGATGDRLVPSDYSGDGRDDIAVFRPSTGQWRLNFASDTRVTVYSWGQSGDVPVPGDYDNDGKTDVAVWRPLDGTFYVRKSSTGTPLTQQWGVNGDVPAASAFVHGAEQSPTFSLW